MMSSISATWPSLRVRSARRRQAEIGAERVDGGSPGVERHGIGVQRGGFDDVRLDLFDPCGDLLVGTCERSLCELLLQ